MTSDNDEDDAGDGGEEANFQKVWTLGIGSDRTLGRPREWNGENAGFDDFAFKFENWVSGLPGGADSLLEASSKMPSSIEWDPMGPKQKVMARGVATALRALVGGKALNLIRYVPERQNGFEMWRLVFREYRPDTATRKVALLERVMEDSPTSSEEFGDWFVRWLDLVSQTELARGRPIDDDIKCAVVLKRSPKELKDHLVMLTATIADKFPVMREIVGTWNHSKRSYGTPAMGQRQVPMEIGAVSAESSVGGQGPSVSWVSGWPAPQWDWQKGKGKGNPFQKGKGKGKPWQKGKGKGNP